MSLTLDKITALVEYRRSLTGDEKGEAQVFCDRLFQAFGHAGYKEAGATLEFRVKRKGVQTRYADLLWRPRVLLEMKSRGERLQKHYRQAFEYWIELVPDRPTYVVLCNFDEFWIYDFNRQLDEPLDKVKLSELADRYTALNFMFQDNRKPMFDNDRVEVTEQVAKDVASVFKTLVDRGEDRNRAQRFILQCVVGMFSEDFDLLPQGMFTELLGQCANGDSSYDLLGALFNQMNSPRRSRAGRFKDVDYFNGGLFKIVDPVELTKEEAKQLCDASSKKWSKVSPPIFGTLFQNSMKDEIRHSLGAHFTSEADIQSVILPSIIRPWRERITGASTLAELVKLSKDLLKFRVLDPACGSGNFLYIAYRELVSLEMEILSTIHEKYGVRARRQVGTATMISTTQFFGMDIDPFAVELAKVTLMLGKRIAVASARQSIAASKLELPYKFEEPLPLDNLDKNIRQCDALFEDWPQADVIIGNPPYQSKNKMQVEYGRAYLNRLKVRYPDIPGKADYCVYWFRRAHDELSDGARAGLVGTNTIRQNNSREGGLDHIVDNGGVICDAVSSQYWSGDAAVQVSIVNWIKGELGGKKILRRQLGERADSPWERFTLDRIGAALSGRFDVTKAAELRINQDSDTCNQGQTQGHAGFLLAPDEAKVMFKASADNKMVIFPFLIGDDFLGSNPPAPQRYVIDFHPREILAAQTFTQPFSLIKNKVLKDRERKAALEAMRNAEAIAEDPDGRVNKHHANFLRRWWLLSYPRGSLKSKLAKMTRYIVCSRVTKRPIFVFVDSKIHPNDSLQVFTFDDDYSFGILQSRIHWSWFTERCSTLTERPRYTSETVFDSFPWPQSPKVAQVKAIAGAAIKLRRYREGAMIQHKMTLRDLYRVMDMPGESQLKSLHASLDAAVSAAYGMSRKADPLEFLFELNKRVAEREMNLKPVIAPGVPPCARGLDGLISKDCIQPFALS